MGQKTCLHCILVSKRSAGVKPGVSMRNLLHSGEGRADAPQICHRSLSKNIINNTSGFKMMSWYLLQTRSSIIKHMKSNQIAFQKILVLFFSGKHRIHESCPAVKKVMDIKTFKTGSSTFLNILYRCSKLCFPD